MNHQQNNIDFTRFQLEEKRLLLRMYQCMTGIVLQPGTSDGVGANDEAASEVHNFCFCFQYYLLGPLYIYTRLPHFEEERFFFHIFVTFNYI